MHSAKDLGRKSFHMPPSEQEAYRDYWVSYIVADVESKKELLQLEMKVCAEEEKKVIAELSKYNMPEEAVVDALKGKSLNDFRNKAKRIEINREAELKPQFEELEALAEMEDRAKASDIESKVRDRIDAINNKFDKWHSCGQATI